MSITSIVIILLLKFFISKIGTLKVFVLKTRVLTPETQLFSSRNCFDYKSYHKVAVNVLLL